MVIYPLEYFTHLDAVVEVADIFAAAAASSSSSFSFSARSKCGQIPTQRRRGWRIDTSLPFWAVHTEAGPVNNVQAWAELREAVEAGVVLVLVLVLVTDVHPLVLVLVFRPAAHGDRWRAISLKGGMAGRAGGGGGGAAAGAAAATT
jgi:hypothetical protein